MNVPRVSVVVPAFENEAHIAATMDSILAQTYPDFELVVADHSSTDRTWVRLQPYASERRVRLLRTPAGGGAGRNWNRVTTAAVGELVKLVCGDDVLYPGALDVQVAAYDRGGPGVVMVASTRDVVDAGGRTVIGDLGLRRPLGRRDGRAVVRQSVRAGRNLFGEPAAVLLHRETIAAVGGWHGDPGYLIDQNTYARVLLRGDLIVAPGPVAAFRLSSSQWSVRLAAEQARSAARMHRQLADLDPGLLSPTDVRLGNLRAAVRARQRRLVYAWLGRRMRSDPT